MTLLKALGIWAALAFAFGLGMVCSAALDERSEWDRFKAATAR